MIDKENNNIDKNLEKATEYYIFASEIKGREEAVASSFSFRKVK